MALDKKSKKRLEVLRKRVPTLEQKIALTREQEDEPGEVAALEKQLEETRAEIKVLKKPKWPAFRTEFDLGIAWRKTERFFRLQGGNFGTIC